MKPQNNELIDLKQTILMELNDLSNVLEEFSLSKKNRIIVKLNQIKAKIRKWGKGK